jgi:hypothetical protein
MHVAMAVDNLGSGFKRDTRTGLPFTSPGQMSIASVTLALRTLGSRLLSTEGS